MRLAGNEISQRRDESTPTKPVAQAHAQPWTDHVDDDNSDQDEDDDRHGTAPADDDDAMLDGVIIPAIESVSNPASEKLTKQLSLRVPNNEARQALHNLRQAFEEAERLIPGVTGALVSEIVESVEQVEQ